MPRVAAIINTLQDKMLVIKKTDLNDKRKTIITITEKGKKDILQKRKRAIIFIESIIKELTDEEIMQYISINKKIEEISNNLKD